MTQEPNPIIDPLPGCKGHCLQGHRPCLSPEECWPEDRLFTQKTLALIALITVGVWFAVFFLGAIFAWWVIL